MKRLLPALAIFAILISCVSYTNSSWKSTSGNVVLILDDDTWTLFLNGTARRRGTYKISKNRITLVVTAQFANELWCEMSTGATWSGSFTEKDRLEINTESGTYVLYRD